MMMSRTIHALTPEQLYTQTCSVTPPEQQEHTEELFPNRCARWNTVLELKESSSRLHGLSRLHLPLTVNSHGYVNNVHAEYEQRWTIHFFIPFWTSFAGFSGEFQSTVQRRRRREEKILNSQVWGAPDEINSEAPSRWGLAWQGVEETLRHGRLGHLSRLGDPQNIELLFGLVPLKICYLFWLVRLIGFNWIWIKRRSLHVISINLHVPSGCWSPYLFSDGSVFSQGDCTSRKNWQTSTVFGTSKRPNSFRHTDWALYMIKERRVWQMFFFLFWFV